MKRTRNAVLWLAMCGPMAAGTIAAPEEPVIVAQDLKKLRSPGVAAVLWTARKDYCTLQVVFPNRTRISEGKPAAAKPAGVQIWLLKADGSLIPPIWRSTEVSSKSQTDVGPLRDVLYRFPLSAGKEAVAAAVQVGDTLLVDQITPFKD